MNYADVKFPDIANGTGIRVSLFVSGCRRHCPGCFNKETWDFAYGKPFGANAICEIKKHLSKPYCTGLSILGGEPLEPENRVKLATLLHIVKEEYPDKTVWLYTGNKYEDIKDLEIMQYVDVVVDGEFVMAEKKQLPFRGSANQRIINLGRTSNA